MMVPTLCFGSRVSVDTDDTSRHQYLFGSLDKGVTLPVDAVVNVGDVFVGVFGHAGDDAGGDLSVEFEVDFGGGELRPVS